MGPLTLTLQMEASNTLVLSNSRSIVMKWERWSVVELLQILRTVDSGQSGNEWVSLTSHLLF